MPNCSNYIQQSGSRPDRKLSERSLNNIPFQLLLDIRWILKVHDIIVKDSIRKGETQLELKVKLNELKETSDSFNLTRFEKWITEITPVMKLHDRSNTSRLESSPIRCVKLQFSLLYPSSNSLIKEQFSRFDRPPVSLLEYKYR